MFEKIKSIIINNGSPGESFVSEIYNHSCIIGFSAQPTRIFLNVVNENGIYNFPTINLQDKYNISLMGNVFSGMKFYSYEKNKSAGNSTATINFLDNSLILDKIFVALLHRHGNKYFH